jgi:hypothetical protein
VAQAVDVGHEEYVFMTRKEVLLWVCIAKTRRDLGPPKDIGIVISGGRRWTS